MIPPNKLEEAYAEFSENLQKWIPDGIIQVNLNLLQELGLLSNQELEQNNSDNLMHYFHVIETPDKVTLFNDKFAIWIVPKMEGENPTTLTFIALLHQDKAHLEIVFSTTGVYNTPRFILKVLQHFLNEVIDTESIISNIDKPTGT
ncbi:MAG: hypothetical protein JSR58_00835 [Verrucomicrobia bacterium]|nr:hypothetical protein [Verrucomicrobiota bacterium]